MSRARVGNVTMPSAAGADGAADGGAGPLVMLRNVGKAYRSASGIQPVIEDLSMDIAAGEFLVLLGPSGCGKTTLLNLIGGLDRADEGRLVSCGWDLTTARRAELTAYRARDVGFVFQFYNLLPTLTAVENVEAAVTVTGVSRDRARATAHSFLDRVGLAGAAGKFPAQLSGGEQQRVAIARALAKSPSLVLADEPTGNLDQARAGEVIDVMRRLGEQTGATFVVVTHDPTVAAAGSRTVRLAGGRIAGDGEPG